LQKINGGITVGS